MSLARFSVRNPVPVNLLMIAIIVVGTVSLIRLPRELMSDISFNWVFISKPYPGVSAEEIEKLITIPIEDEIRDIKGIEFIASQSSEGQSFIQVRFVQMSDEEFRARYQDLRAEVDKVKDLPIDAMDTQIMSFSSADFMPLLSVHLYSQIPEKDLRELARQLRDELLLVPKVSKVELTGIRDREVWVEADPHKLRGLSLSPQQLQTAIQRSGRNVPAGRFSMGRQEILVRTVGEFDHIDEIEKVIVRATPDGRKIRVDDVAKVRDTFEEERTRSRLNGQPVISLAISKDNDGSSIAVIDGVKKIAKAFEQRHSALLKVAFTQDSSEPIRDMISKLSTNAWLGFAIVLLVLLAVLGIRNAILAALGIPISFLACFTFMYYFDESFNGNSLFGLVLVLGIIVDDAIVIVENCYRHLQLGKSWKEAAVIGTEEVMLPVLSATATTIAAFLPLILLPGIIGKFMQIVPITVSLALTASLVEAFVILPSHFADWPGRNVQMHQERPWLFNIRRRYERALRRVVRRRGWFTFGAFVVVLGALGLIPLVGVDMYAGEEVNTFQVRVTMPTGTNLDATAATLAEFEKAAATLPKDEVRAIHATAGMVMTDSDWFFRTDVGQLWLDLPMSYARKRSSEEIMQELRGKIGHIVGPINIEFAKVNTGPPLGKPVEIKVKGKYLDQLQQATAEIKTYLKSLDGVFDIGDDFLAGKQEVRVYIDPDKASLYGLSVVEVGLALRAALDGAQAGKLYDGDEEIEIIVRIDKQHFERPEDLLRLPLVLHNGKTISLGDVAEYKMKSSYAEIRRYRNQRAITVFANIDKQKTTSVKVNQMAQKRFAHLASKYPGVSLDFSGEFQEFKEAFSNLAILFSFGVLLIYVILGAQFRSYIQPVVILFTVPFAAVGAIFGLIISGNYFSVITMFGMVALAGVAVNDAIVMVSFVNNAKAEGMAVEEAIIQAGVLRLRPIILTTVTTIAGLLPMALGIGGMSLTWSPLANTIVWGLSVATLFTLFIIPALFLIVVHDIPRIFRRKQKGKR